MTGQLSFAARDLALMQVENNHQVFVETMRSVAKRLLREMKVISADDLHEWADANNEFDSQMVIERFRMNRICEVCNCPFDRVKKESLEQYSTRKYCSVKCSAKARKGKVPMNVVQAEKRVPAIIHNCVNTFLYAYGRVS